MRVRLRAILLLVLGFPAVVDAQVLVGHVLEEGAGTPVGGAELRLVDSDGRERAAVVTDSSGWFQLRAPGAGDYSLHVRHVAFVAYTADVVSIDTNQSLEIEIRLGREVIPLEPLVVTARRVDRGRLAGFRERMATNAFGDFVTREQIERRPGAMVSDLVRTIPGVRVVPVKRGNNPQGLTTDLILMRGSGNEPAPEGADRDLSGYCMPAIFLDGMRIRQSANQPIDDLLRSPMLEGIEVYSSVAAVPTEFQMADNCGVIVLWTQEGGGSGGGRGWKRLAVGLTGFALILFLLR